MCAMLRRALLGALVLVVGCRPGMGDVRPTPAEPPALPSVVEPCDERQKALSQEADRLASPYGIDAHVEKNFKDRGVSWLMTDAAYQKFVVQTGAKHFGRCNDAGCYLFAAPTETIQQAVAKSMVEGKHDPASLGQALGLPAKNFEGPLRLMTLNLAASRA